MKKPVSKLFTFRELKEHIKTLKAEGKKIIFTNGCFDILHPGHIRYLSASKALGDYLIVAINSDQSVRAIKGQLRPIMSEKDRAELLSSLYFVDAVIIFDEEDPLRLIKELVPDILVKGGDWEENKIIGADYVKRAGGKVVRIPYINGYSTTRILNRIKGGKGNIES